MPSTGFSVVVRYPKVIPREYLQSLVAEGNVNESLVGRDDLDVGNWDFAKAAPATDTEEMNAENAEKPPVELQRLQSVAEDNAKTEEVAPAEPDKDVEDAEVNELSSSASLDTITAAAAAVRAAADSQTPAAASMDTVQKMLEAASALATAAAVIARAHSVAAVQGVETPPDKPSLVRVPIRKTDQHHHKLIQRVVTEKLGFKDSFITENAAGTAVEISFVVADYEMAEAVISELHLLGLGVYFGSYTIYALDRHMASLSCPAVGPPAKKDQTDDQENLEMQHDLGLIYDHVYKGIKGGAALTLDYCALCLVAGLLAAVALCVNSTVTVVASMLVSPLMGPILATCLGAALRDWRMAGWGVLLEVTSLGACVLIGFFVGMGFLPYADSLEIPTSEMLSRGNLLGLLLGVLIAVPSGLGVALSVLGSNQSSLVGVAISASLLPPAVNCGVFWAFAALGGEWHPQQLSAEERWDHFKMGGLSLSLTLVNIVCIYLVAYLTFRFKIEVNYPKKPLAFKYLAFDAKYAQVIKKGDRAGRADVRYALREWRNLEAKNLGYKVDASLVNRLEGAQENTVYIKKKVNNLPDLFQPPIAQPHSPSPSHKRRRSIINFKRKIGWEKNTGEDSHDESPADRVNLINLFTPIEEET